MYIKATYLDSAAIPVPSQLYIFCIGLTLIYPALYDGTQAYKEGPTAYLASLWNWVDMIHIIGGYTNLYL